MNATFQSFLHELWPVLGLLYSQVYEQLADSLKVVHEILESGHTELGGQLNGCITVFFNESAETFVVVFPILFVTLPFLMWFGTGDDGRFFFGGILLFVFTFG